MLTNSNNYYILTIMNNELIINKSEYFMKKCREHKLRITPQRSAIYELLTDSTEHPSADMIYHQVKILFPHISFDTVYRTLMTFTDIGLVNVVEGYGESKRFEPNLRQHHHFRCIKCHRIIDFDDKALNSLEIPENLKQKYHIINQRVVLEGICDQCIKD
jgi:Fur family transcriptional regulator, peroxide stress response regulator